MRVKRDTWLDQGGLNVIRIVIGSYVCAVALGLPSGFDPYMLVGAALPGEAAALAGAAVLVVLSLCFMCGFFLRGASLLLAAYLIVSSVVQLMAGGAGEWTGAWIGAWTGAASGTELHVGALLQTIVLGAAMLLCYGPLKPHEMHRAALFSPVFARSLAARFSFKRVVPRRISPRAHAAPAKTMRRRGVDPVGRNMGPMIAPTEQMMGRKSPGVRSEGHAAGQTHRPDPFLDDDIDNIFVNL